MADEKKVKDFDQFPLRLPDGLRLRIKMAAKNNGRSMNQEIVQSLEQIYPQPDSIDDVFAEISVLTNTLDEKSHGEIVRDLRQALDHLKQALYHRNHIDPGDEDDTPA